MDFVAYTLSQRFVMFAVIALVAWIVPASLCQSVPSRSWVSLAEYTSAYRAHDRFGLDLGDSPVRVLRTVGLVIAALVAAPELLGML